MARKRNYLEELREGLYLSNRDLVRMVIQLSIPAILAQISSIIMQYIDASMVGQLGALDSASIGLVGPPTWLMGGLCHAAGIGFSVQVAHKIGAGDERGARSIVKHGLMVTFLFGLMMALLGAGISGPLPGWLGAGESIRAGASAYFMIYSLGYAASTVLSTAGGMLQNSGSMRIPAILEILMCALDVIFNALLIFPARVISIAGRSMDIPGAGLGVSGAALGTCLAELVCTLLMLYFLLVRSKALHLRREKTVGNIWAETKRALQIAVPVGMESAALAFAQVVAVRIVSPLGNIAIAANSFSVTAESLCYMPGYGLGAAATALVGQSIGAKRPDMTRKLSWLTVGLGMAIQGSAGVLMYIFAPQMIGMLSPDPAIRELGTQILRIEAWAEPMYAASIIASGVFRGMADTLMPFLLNLFSMWVVRLPLAAWLAPRIGLKGVWIAMCLELCVRGMLFLIRLVRKTGKNVKK